MVTYFTRAQWGARPPQNRTPFVDPPAKRAGITIHHNGPALHIPVAAGSPLIAQAIQRYHMDTNGWSDGAYSWMFDNFGQIFELRGLVWDQFANGDDLVGDYEGGDIEWYTAMWMGGGDEVPSAAAYEAATSIVSLVRTAGAGLKVRPHNQFQIKACPGPEFTLWCDRWNQRPFPIEPASSGQQAHEVEEEEDMRQFVLSSDGAIYELVQQFANTPTVKRHVEGAEWSVLAKFYESKLTAFPASVLANLKDA